MKTIKLFMMAALALMTAACSSDDNDITTPTPQPVKPEGIPFSATISSSEDATTRALSEDTENNTIKAAWKTGEKVALIYTVNDTKQLVVAEVTANTDHSATIKATLTGSPADGTPVEIVYPASAVDASTNAVKDLPTLLVEQTGSLTNISEKYDLRQATGMLKIEGENNSQTASLKESVKLESQLAIFLIKAKNGEANVEMNSLVVKIDGTRYVNITKNPNSAQSYFYIALPAVTNKLVSFMVKDIDGNVYDYSKNVTFAAGKYYQSTLSSMTKRTGEFSVSDEKKVCFSQGNLQHQVSTNIWRFADEQWASFTVSNVYSTDFMDLFTWGNISSPEAYGTFYDKYSSTLDNTKAPGAANSSTGSDWGYNAISNGGNKNSQWRTLTNIEWKYVLNTRETGGTVFSTSKARYTGATINTDDGNNGVKGIILFPDGVNIASNEVTNAGNVNEVSNYTTTCTSDQWTALEAKGCIFLPCANRRTNGATISGDGVNGYYWSASAFNDNVAFALEFSGSNLNIPTTWTGDANKQLGYSVRLVRDLYIIE